MSGIMKSVTDFIFGKDEYEETVVENETDRYIHEEFPTPQFTKAVQQPTVAPKRQQSPKGNVAYIHATTQLEVFIIAPETYDEAKEIIDHLKSKNAVVANLEKLSKEAAQSTLDFIGGAVYALDANIQKVSGGTFLVAPYNVGITNDVRAELKNRGIFSGITRSYD